MASAEKNTETEINKKIVAAAEEYIDKVMNKKFSLYKLTFTFDDRIYSTILKFDNTGIQNECLELLLGFEDPDESDFLSSYIKSNSPKSKCFSPILSEKDNLPPGVTQTDILQVLMSKLNFIFIKGSRIIVEDNARLLNPATGEMYTTLLSEWRLLRDEPTLYEKYGYNSPELDEFRRIIRNIKWNDIKNYKIPRTGKTILDIWNTFYSAKGIPDDGQTIPTIMRRLTLTELEESLTEVPYFQTESEEINHRNRMSRAGILLNDKSYITIKNIHRLIVDALNNLGIIIPYKKLYLQKSSEVWKRWDARLVLRLFEPVSAGGRRKTRKRKVHRQSRKNFR